MNVVFADAFYFVARLNRRDQYHERVLKFSREFQARLLTSDWVLMEVADRNVRDALTGDKHFEQAGFVALLK